NRADAIAIKRFLFLPNYAVNVQPFFVCNQLELRSRVHAVENVLQGLVLDLTPVHPEHLRSEHIRIFFTQRKRTDRTYVDNELIAEIFRQLLHGFCSTYHSNLELLGLMSNGIDGFLVDEIIELIEVKSTWVCSYPFISQR